MAMPDGVEFLAGGDIFCFIYFSLNNMKIRGLHLLLDLTACSLTYMQLHFHLLFTVLGSGHTTSLCAY